MRARKKSFALIALLTALMLIAAACGGDDDGGGIEGADPGEDTAEVQEGGTLVFGAEQEPAEGLNGDLACCTLFWQTVIFNQVLEGAWETNPDFEYVPNILEADPEVSEDPFTLTLKIRDEAQWNDGTPITAEDFLFTVETIMNPKHTVASTAGYDQIDIDASREETEALGDEKQAVIVFSEPFAAYRDLWNPLHPAHALEGENFNKVWNDSILNPKTGDPIASGPFMFDSYNKGAQLTLVKNPEYWGEHPAYLDEIVFRFVPETNTEIQQLRGGEVDAIYPQPQLELANLVGLPDVEIQTNAGTTWEHIDIQVGENGHPALKNDYVRQALAYGMDREALTSQLFKDIAPELTPLNNTIYMQNQEEYVPNWEEYTYDPEQAESLLTDNGCTKGGDGIYECDGEKLSFGYTSTAGNALRELSFEIVQEQLRQIGIEVKSEFGDAAVVFGNKVLVAGNYDLFMFAWVGSPDPSGSVEIWKCEGGQNFHGYCNEEATELLDASQSELDPAARADLLNQADEIMSQDIPTIPLYQKPTFFAYNVKLHNAIDNPTDEGPTWNSEDWWIEQ